MKSLQEYKEELMEQEEVELIDFLHITSEELVDRFDDKVEDKYESLEDEEFDEDEQAI